MPLIDDAIAGFRTVKAEGALKEAAIGRLGEWLTNDTFAAYRPQLEWLIGQRQWAGLLDRFFQVLPFGTGGRRGPVGIGPNRMNQWTLGASVQGHCEYLKERFPGEARLQVALAFDVRRFEDRGGNYNRNLPNPVLGLSSRDFARHAAEVYAGNSIHVHILPPESTRFLATPELSFIIRKLNCHGGLNVSASHNPPDDNGGKFYDDRGAQPVPPDDQIMSDLVEQVTHIESMPWADAVRGGKIHFLDDSSHHGYIDLCRKQSLIGTPKFDEIDVVYTPLHGVGSMTAFEVLEQSGFRPKPVPEQMEPNGQFPNVTKSPNPEVPESLDRAIALATERGADIVLATDPDADRIGAAAADGQGGFRFLTGNEICALLTHFKIERLLADGRMPSSPVVIVTEVTTRLVTRIAQHFGVQIVNNLPVGLKYVAEVLRQLETEGRYEDVTATPADYIIGGEESHGILATPQMRDKDAASAALLLAELALHCKRRGWRVPDYLENLHRQFGYFRNELRNIILTGIEGKQRMVRMMDLLRFSPPKTIAGLNVTDVEDWRDEDGRMGPLKGATDAASRNVLLFHMGESARLAIRPSGTEPKAKVYAEICSAPRPSALSDTAWQSRCRAIEEQCRQLADDFADLANNIVKP
jgi:phosphoglucomutase/phosphomannomutase